MESILYGVRKTKTPKLCEDEKIVEANPADTCCGNMKFQYVWSLRCGCSAQAQDLIFVFRISVNSIENFYQVSLKE